MATEKNHSTHDAKPQPDSNLAIISMVLGVVSLTGPGLLLGIPAIITASIALKKDVGGRGLSIAGLVTGIISTVLSLIFVAFVAFWIAWGINHPEDFDQHNMTPQQNETLYNSSRT